MLHDPQSYTVFAGRTMKGWPVITISRGEVVVTANESLGQPGRGPFVPRYGR
jgi:dihydropyrimidinase